MIEGFMITKISTSQQLLLHFVSSFVAPAEVVGCLSVTSEAGEVVFLPVGTAGRSDDLVVSVSLAHSTVLLSSCGESTEFSVFVDGLAQPVESWVGADAFVGGVNHDYFEVFVGGVLSDPV